MSNELLGDLREVSSLTDAQLLSILKRAAHIEKFLAEVKEQALKNALAGRPLPGTKLVAGRTTRSWVKGAEPKIIKLLEEAGENEVADILYEPQKMKSVAALEKDIGAKAFKPLEVLVDKSDGKPALAFEDDPRPALSTGTKDLFKEEWE